MLGRARAVESVGCSMNTTERLGFMIVTGVFLFMVVGIIIYTLVFPLLAIGNVQNGNWFHGWRLPLRGVAVLMGFVVVGRAFWMGHERARWITCIVLVLMGAAVIGLACWMTTLDYPNAENPAVRAEMQADDWRDLPWRVGQGIAPIVMGALLLLPPVGRFLSYRRKVQAVQDAATNAVA
jgi:hypothetical protein